ncbi:hypothetical protein CEXT_625471 [Caerostris extrusa]|uniref:Uncharacterized protein n=1 Tax=Caerostris extrusa TaxID=172846 RepID=A0AAV4S8S6_CAEEX|nr:hypothetical protein CEXT_625471 [Caerostris extrusa]
MISMRLYYLSSEEKSKQSLTVITCHAKALQQRGMGLRKLHLINRQPPATNLMSGIIAMRLHYLSSEESPKQSLTVIICHAMALQQRGMGLRKLRLINRQPSSNEFKASCVF